VNFEIPNITVDPQTVTCIPASSEYPAGHRIMIEPQFPVPFHGDLSFSQRCVRRNHFAVNGIVLNNPSFFVGCDTLHSKMFLETDDAGSPTDD
jgi:hypothetical protein